MASTIISQVTEEIALHAVQDGMVISGIDSNSELTKIRVQDESMHTLFRRLPSLISDGIFHDTKSGLFASLEDLHALEMETPDPLESAFEWSPYDLKITHQSAAGLPDFRLHYQFYLGNRIVPVKKIGIFCWRNKAIARLWATQAIAANVCDIFNQIPDSEKDSGKAFHALYELQQLAGENTGISLDSYLNSEEVVCPDKISLDHEVVQDKLFVFPKIEGVTRDELKKQFQNLKNVDSVYDIKTATGRQRVLINDELLKIFREVKQNGNGITGERKSNYFRNPRTILPESEDLNSDLISIDGFGPRVIGIGYPQFVRPVRPKSLEDWLNMGGNEESFKESAPKYEIECEYCDGKTEPISFKDLNEVRFFVAEVKSELDKNSSEIKWEEKSIPISKAFLNSCEEIIAQEESRISEKKAEKDPAKALLIHTNENALDFVEQANNLTEELPVAIPSSLKQDKSLKQHQISGLKWLQNLVHNDVSKGALLADEMGLGKTLLLLSLSAWLVETKYKRLLGQPNPPYHPILVVAPLILVDNWKTEISNYFDGDVFLPLEVLHGSNIQKYKSSSLSGLGVGKYSLDISKLTNNRVVITNYDTVKNYQYSLAQVSWSLVIVDEAQEIKEPNTATTHALKALNPFFRIASTGTPVETSLTNLWSIMDFAHPGNSLGSLSDFNKEFVSKEFNDDSLGSELRRRLNYNELNGLIFRRTKKEVLKDLPPKNFLRIECEIDDLHKSLYAKIREDVVKNEKQQEAALAGLHQVSLLAQHPFLIEPNPFRTDHKEYIAASPKLKELLKVLGGIQAKSEKVLLFTRSRNMQDILKHVLDSEFNLNVKIVNGTTKTKHKYHTETRTGIIKDFSESEGFNILILSPEVAGVGLTITAANHVIHYGRWWNPAKENQATDRAYRIGQVKPVYVYHIINKDQNNLIETFDEKLERRLKTREDLADNFLTMGTAEGSIQDGLVDDLFGQASPTQKSEVNPTGNKISKEHLKAFSGYDFEVFISLLLSDRFNKTIITPKGRDGGFDVVGINEKEICLIQCKLKQDTSDLANFEEVLDEMNNSRDFYREQVIPRSVNRLPLKLLLAVTSSIDKPTKNSAKKMQIDLLEIGDVLNLMRKSNITKQDVLTAARTRSLNLAAVTVQLSGAI